MASQIRLAGTLDHEVELAGSMCNHVRLEGVLDGDRLTLRGTLGDGIVLGGVATRRVRLDGRMVLSITIADEVCVDAKIPGPPDGGGPGSRVCIAADEWLELG